METIDHIGTGWLNVDFYLTDFFQFPDVKCRTFSRLMNLTHMIIFSTLSSKPWRMRELIVGVWVILTAAAVNPKDVM